MLLLGIMFEGVVALFYSLCQLYPDFILDVLLAKQSLWNCFNELFRMLRLNLMDDYKFPTGLYFIYMLCGNVVRGLYAFKIIVSL